MTKLWLFSILYSVEKPGGGMKKEKIHSEEERQKPHLPSEGRERIRQGGAHKNKKKYDRKRDKKKREKEVTE